ncbi:MAG: AAA family ATPase [Chitinispirillales bacterium]|jgi:hypothetical protein|nr:AAA family ATPase [Chitinispirillales bacterium]
MKTKRLLPIGIQDFISIREDGYVYVDKTERIHQLITGSGRAFFLSRPRRFGKSLLCSTLEAVFQGRRELFQEIAGRPSLAINSLDWQWKKHPVIRLDLNAGDYSQGGAEALHNALLSELQAQAEKHKIELPQADIISQFKYLIRKASEKGGERAAVIIDEYDKPLLTTINDTELHLKNREKLKGFYSVLKSSDEYLQFVFLTGVTKFSQVSIFSDLNHLVDLTLDQRYGDICGLTQNEVEQNFVSEIETILKDTSRNREDYIEKLPRYYNGYRFSKKPLTVYNPFGLLKHFDSGGEFLPYWYETGTPAFLVKLITKQKINIVNLNDKWIRYENLRKFDIENMDAVTVLYQSGYLTISKYDEERERCALDYPNEEVSSALGPLAAASCAATPRTAKARRKPNRHGQHSHDSPLAWKFSLCRYAAINTCCFNTETVVLHLIKSKSLSNKRFTR